MKTVMLSPLKRAIASGLLVPQYRRTRRDNDIGRNAQPRLGERGCDSADPRHVGVVVAVNWSHVVVLKFENGWRTEVPLTRYTKVETGE